MFKINMRCDRCDRGEHARWVEARSCYLCAECRVIEEITDKEWADADSQ